MVRCQLLTHFQPSPASQSPGDDTFSPTDRGPPGCSPSIWPEPEEPGSFLEYAAFDGILGLGHPSLALPGTTPVFGNLWEQGLLAQNLFAFYLSSKDQRGSVLMLGGLDPSCYSGELNWVPVSTPTYWQLEVDSISMNGKVIACDGGCQGIIDTGTLLLNGRPNSILNLQKIINAQPSHNGQYVVDCNTIDSLPDILFTMDGIHYPVPASAYVQKSRSHTCYSSFEGLDHPFTSETWILGGISLRLYFTVFDGASRIGLAPAAQMLSFSRRLPGAPQTQAESRPGKLA